MYYNTYLTITTNFFYYAIVIKCYCNNFTNFSHILVFGTFFWYSTQGLFRGSSSNVTYITGLLRLNHCDVAKFQKTNRTLPFSLMNHNLNLLIKQLITPDIAMRRESVLIIINPVHSFTFYSYSYLMNHNIPLVCS